MSQLGGRAALERARNCWRRRDLYAAKQFAESVLTEDLEGPILAEARLTAAVIYREIGDAAEAMRHLVDLTLEWHRYPELQPTLEGYAWFNRALIHYQMRQYADAVACDRLAVEAFRREGTCVLLIKALHNLAWSLCHLGDADAAVDALQEAEGILPPDDDVLLWHHRLGYALCTYTDERYQEALDLLDDILRSETAPPDVLAQAMWLCGRSLLGLGRLSEALHVADSAIQYSLQTQDTRCMSQAQSLRREIVERQSRGA